MPLACSVSNMLRHAAAGLTMMLELNWAGLQGHQSAGQVQHAHSSVQWATEYLIKCHISKHAFVGQVWPCLIC